MDDQEAKIRLVKYIILQISIVPSLLCDLFVFAYIIRNWKKEIVNAPQNHVIALMLLTSFIQKTAETPLSLYFLYWGTVFKESDGFCMYWSYIDFSLLIACLHLITWCAIERHLFVFHGQIMKKKWCLIVFHYIPMFVSLLVGPMFYFGTIIVFTECTNMWIYTYMFCGGPCYAYIPFWGAFDWIFISGIAIVILFFANVLLFHRFMLQKRRHQRIVQFNQKRRIIIQLSFTSLLYLILPTPAVIFGVIQAVWLPTFGLDMQANYFIYACSFTSQLLPYVIISSFPGVRHEFRSWIDRIRRYFGGRARVQVQTITITQKENGKSRIMPTELAMGRIH